MTENYHGKIPVICPCGCNFQFSVTAEPAINAELRAHPRIDSRNHCMVIGDCDLIMYRYGMRFSPERRSNRDIRFHMIVELKGHHEPGRRENPPSFAQAEQLWVTGKLLQSVREFKNNTRGGNGQWLIDHTPNVRHLYVDIPAFGDHKAQKNVLVLGYGTHLLQYSADTLKNSEYILWDKKLVGYEEILDILAFDRNPLTLKPMDHVRMHKAYKEAQQPPLTLFD